MKPLLPYIISSFILFLPLRSMAQDSLEMELSKLAIYVSIDYGKGIETLLQKQTKWEFGGGVILGNHYNFVGEYGFGSLNPESVIQNGNYNSAGSYFKVGFEYMVRVKAKRYISFGAMYGSSNFDDSGVITIKSELWGDVEESFLRTNLSASWVEAILNTEGPISNAEKGFLSQFYWGVKFRLRFLITDLTQPVFDIYAIPGFGRTYNNMVPAANFYLKYRLNF